MTISEKVQAAREASRKRVQELVTAALERNASVPKRGKKAAPLPKKGKGKGKDKGESKGKGKDKSVVPEPVKVPEQPEQPVEKAKKPSRAEKAEAAVREAEGTTVKLTTNQAPAIELNTELHTAFDHFNMTLFGGKLAPVMFSNVRLKKSFGHHWPASWARRKDLKGKIDEIGLDFSRLREQHQGDKEVLSTLVHEMCHQLVSMLPGKPERGHGLKWVAAMNMVGLRPVILDSKGVPTGKATGPNATHEIVEGGPFDLSAKTLLSGGFKFSWFNEPMPQPEKKPSTKKRAGAKAKHTCPSCQRNAWGAPSLHLYCKGDPESEHELVEMECDRGAYEGGEEGAEE